MLQIQTPLRHLTSSVEAISNPKNVEIFFDEVFEQNVEI
jgi:hypothetical protein